MNFFLPKLSFKNCFLVSSISYNKYQIGSSVDNYNIKAYKCELNIFYHAMKKKTLTSTMFNSLWLFECMYKMKISVL